MQVVRGRASTLEGDRAVTGELCRAAADGERAVRVWLPHRQVAFGRRDTGLAGYERARALAHESAFAAVERRVGGRAVAYDGETTVAFARAEPVDDVREGIGERYDRLTADLESALATLGVETSREEPANSFCPGSHSLSVRVEGRPRKVAGIAQRVRADAALVAGILLVDASRVVAVLERVYEALEVPFDPATVGSLADAGGPGEPAPVLETLEAALGGEETPTVRVVDT
ncbi:lipoyl protein ligase domain-containing protein [Natronobiforma cellulositropha]|uniref:lipoyl protein ligase domain-containing protein n=1 Tax=Natronobiforma cellulositropha TaxID=1679076 RepID=UPI0021D58E56|nr:lipoate--protein ligase family protein [Natronobiforma cellulositropha]